VPPILLIDGFDQIALRSHDQSDGLCMRGAIMRCGDIRCATSGTQGNKHDHHQSYFHHLFHGSNYCISPSAPPRIIAAQLRAARLLPRQVV